MLCSKAVVTTALVSQDNGCAGVTLGLKSSQSLLLPDTSILVGFCFLPSISVVSNIDVWGLALSAWFDWKSNEKGWWECVFMWLLSQAY